MLLHTYLEYPTVAKKLLLLPYCRHVTIAIQSLSTCLDYSYGLIINKASSSPPTAPPAPVPPAPPAPPPPAPPPPCANLMFLRLTANSFHQYTVCPIQLRIVFCLP